MLNKIMLFVVFTFLASVGIADEKTLKTEKEKFSYAVGYQISEGISHDGLDVDIDIVIQAIKDGEAKKEPLVSRKDMREAMMAYRQKMMAQQKQKTEVNKKKGEAFLAENKKKKGVKVTESGLQYEILKAGEGKKPSASDTVVVNYRGTLIDGKEFDSSYKRGQPATFPVKGVIKGWTEALQMMSVGAKWKLVIPYDLAYGARGTGGDIGPFATLIFEVELMEIKKSTAAKAE